MLYEGLKLKGTRLEEGKDGLCQEPVIIELYEDTDQGYYNCFAHYDDGSRVPLMLSISYLMTLARKQKPQLRLMR
jgi:hypothetical protein